MRIAVTGRTGRMGSLVAEEAEAAGHELADATATADAVIDFTHADTTARHADTFAAARTPWVVGTTGLSASDQQAIMAAADHIPIVQAANFSTGVNLLLALAERLARILPPGEFDAEILEMHHRQKVDAPSGTALALGRAVAAGRGTDFAEAAELGRAGHTGPRLEGAIGFATLRGGQVVGEHTLIFAAATEHIALTHRAFDRRVFARGALRAALWTQGKPPGLYSMMDVLGMNEG
jgi:4-hydroxy-tetrahydrodipicolinate reductase